MTEPQARICEYIIANCTLSEDDSAFLQQLLIVDPILRDGDLNMVKFVQLQERTLGYGNEGRIHQRLFEDF